MSKKDLIKRGKDLGLNLKSSMSVYELKARIKEAESSLESSKKEKKVISSKTKGEY